MKTSISIAARYYRRVMYQGHGYQAFLANLGKEKRHSYI